MTVKNRIVKLFVLARKIVCLSLFLMLAGCLEGDEPQNGTPTSPTSNSSDNPPGPGPTTLADTSGLRVSISTTTEITIIWDSHPDRDVKFRLAYNAGGIAPNNCATGSLVYESAIEDRTSTTVTGLTAGTTYAFRLCSLKATLQNNQSILLLSNGITTTGTTLQLPPGDVASLTAVQASSPLTTANLSWASATGASSYRVVVATGTSTPPTNCGSNFVVATTTSMGITDLATNSYHAFRVCSANANQPPNISVGATASVFLNTETPPNPSSPSVSNITSNSATISWTSGGGNTAGFQIAYKISATSFPSSCNDGTVVTTTGTSVNLTSIPNSPNYKFRICAYNGDTVRKYSAGVTGNFSTPIPEVSNLFCSNLSQFQDPRVNWTGGTTRYFWIKRLESSPAISCHDSGAQLVTGVVGSNSKLTNGLLGDTYIIWICGYDTQYSDPYTTGRKIRVFMGNDVQSPTCSAL